MHTLALLLQQQWQAAPLQAISEIAVNIALEVRRRYLPGVSLFL